MATGQSLLHAGSREVYSRLLFHQATSAKPEVGAGVMRDASHRLHH